MNKLNTKNKIIISALLFPAVIAVLLLLVITPAIDDINAMSGDIEARRIELEEKYLRGQSLKKMMENLKNIDARIGDLDQIFIARNDILGFITSLEKTATENNIAQKVNLAVEKDAKQNGYSKIPLQISTEGKFNNQFNYLLDIERSKYYINISSLELSTTASQPSIDSMDSNENKKIQTVIFADTYWQ
jgi:Tfp pilus assembly protein PilO